MAKDNKLTLTIGFDADKKELQEIGNLIEEKINKKIKSGRGSEYYDEISKAFKKSTADADALRKALAKPLSSKGDAKKLGQSYEEVFTRLDKKFISLKGNISKTFSSKYNTEQIESIRTMTKELGNYKKAQDQIRKINLQSKSLGTKGRLRAERTTVGKQIKNLENKKSPLNTNEITQLNQLKTKYEEINKLLQEKVQLEDKVAKILESAKVSSQSELTGKITSTSNKIAEDEKLIITKSEYEGLITLIDQLRQGLKDYERDSNITGDSVVRNFETIEEEERKAAEAQRTFNGVLRELGLPLLTLEEMARAIRRVVSYSYEYVKNLDNALTEIAVVSGKSRQEVLDLTQSFIELSSATGMAVDDIAQASTIFYQQGLDDTAVKQMTEYTAMFAKISGEDVATAADQITAAVNGFGYEANQVNEVVDKMSVLAAHSAASIQELATAMSKGASQANMAGLSFDQYNAYLATMIETTREAPENLGTSLKTIMSRFQEIKKGENTEDDVDVNRVETALRTVNVSLRDTDGQLRDLGDVLNDLGPKWANLDRNTQAYLGTVIAGTRQQSRFISLMQNWDRALELTEDSERSAGAAARMHQSAMEGLDATINKLTNTWQGLISNLVNGDSFKGILKVATTVLKYFGEGNSFIRIAGAAMLLFSTKTVLANASLKAQGKEIHNLNTAWEKVKGIFQIHLQQYDQYILKGEQIDLITEKVRQQRMEYELLNAAQKGATSPDIATTPNGEITGTPEKKGGAGKTSKTNGKTVKTPKGTGKASLKTGLSNAASLMGSIQTGITIGLTVMVGLDWIDQLITGEARIERQVQKTQEAYDEQQQKMEGLLKVMDVAESSLSVYEELSKKMNKSTEEAKKLADAANEIAETIPSAVLGYDRFGNAIIDSTKVKSAGETAEQQLVEEAKTQIGNVGKQATADLNKRALENAKDSKKYKTADTITKIGGGIAGGAAALGGGLALGGVTLPAAAIAGLVSLVAAGVTAVIGSSIAKKREEENQKRELLKDAKEKTFTDENMQKLQESFSYITNAYIKNRDTDEVTEDQKTMFASYMNNAWLDKKIEQLDKKLLDGDLSKKEYEKKVKNLGSSWENVFKTMDDKTLAKAYKKLEEIQNGIGDKSYNDVTKEAEKALEDLEISKDSKLYKTLLQTFKDAAFDGLEYGIDDVVSDLEISKINALKKEKEGSKEYTNVENKYTKAISATKTMSTNEAGFYADSGLTQDVDIFNKIVGEYGTKVQEALTYGTEQAKLQTIGFLTDYQTELENKMEGITNTVGGDPDKLKGKQKEKYDRLKADAEDAKDAIEGIWASMEKGNDIPWSSLWEQFDKITDRAKTAWETVEKLKSGEGIDFSQWKSFTTMLDDIDFSVLDTSQIDKYAQALDSVENGLKVVNGQLYTNAEATKSIASLESMAAEAEIEAIRQKLIAQKATIEVQKSIVDAHIATVKYAIAEAEGSAEASKLKGEADAAWGKANSSINEMIASNEAKTAQSMVDSYTAAIATIGEKYNALYTAMKSGKLVNTEKLTSEIGKIKSKLTQDLNFEKAYDEYSNMSVSQLKKRLEGLQKQSSIYGNSIENIDLKLKTLGLGLNTTMNGLTSGTNKAKDAADEYIGKLKEIMNLLNKLQTLEARGDLLSTYRDIAKGSDWSNFYQASLQNYRDQRNIQKQIITKRSSDLHKEQKDIKGSPIGDVFSFDKYDQIYINWDKYNKLQTQSINGEKTLKELADNLYDEYSDMYGELIDDSKKYAERLKDILDLMQQQIDAYISMEKRVGDAVKGIYQKMLDAKLDAIDTEIKALDKLKEAYDRANKAAEDSRQISNLQTSLKRAMMDTSGASNTKVLDYRDQIRTKLDQMGEDEYTQRLDDIKEALNNQKESLQKSFEEYFEDWSQLYEMIENVILNDPDSVSSVLKSTEEYLQASDIERRKLVDEWEDEYGKAMSGLKDGRTIFDVWEEMLNTRAEVTKTDTDIVGAIEKGANTISNNVSNALKEYNNSLQSAISGAISNAYNAGRSSVPSYSYTPSPGPANSGKKGEEGKTNPPKNYCPENKWYASSYGNQITTGLEKTGSQVFVTDKNGKKTWQNIWHKKGVSKTDIGSYLIWNGKAGKYVEAAKYIPSFFPGRLEKYYDKREPPLMTTFGTVA